MPALTDYGRNNTLTYFAFAERIARMHEVFRELGIEKGDKIALVGFGTLAVQEKAERKGVNPSTGAPITIPAKKVVKFKPSAELAEKVKQ